MALHLHTETCIDGFKIIISQLNVFTPVQMFLMLVNVQMLAKVALLALHEGERSTVKKLP